MTFDQSSKFQHTQNNLTIKGTRDGLLVKFSDGKWDNLKNSLLSHLKNQKNFLTGARLSLDVGNIIIEESEIVALIEQISEFGIKLWALISDSPTTIKNAQSLGLATRLSLPKEDKPSSVPLQSVTLGEEAILIHKTLRSGNRIIFHGHVIVIGDVNPGAEIFAGGNIIVWGKLRGTVHAGAQGDNSAIVCALDLSPTQLRIADKISIAPSQKNIPKPEIARLVDNRVIAETWDF